MIDNKYIEYITRNQVQLERFKAGQANELNLKIQALVDDITVKLVTAHELTRTEFNRLLAELKRIQKRFYLDYREELAASFVELSALESQREIDTLQRIYLASDYKAKTATAEQLAALIATRPLQVGRQGAGILLESLIKDWTDSQIKLVNGAIQTGYSTGQTGSQIIQRVRGTRANNYKDGITNILKRDAESIVRTGYQHVSNIARQRTWFENDDYIVGYRIVATLDNRTSQICRSLDGRVYENGKGPVPPFHIRCRTQTAPEIDPEFSFLKQGATRSSDKGYVSADLDYYGWLKTQPASFQNDVLGPTRAKIFRNGGLSVEQFKRLQLDKNLRPISLEELRQKAPQAFDAANI